MNVLSAENLAKSYGERVLFSELTFGLSAGDKVALIAKNGSGKTSLMRILSNQESADSGRLSFRKGVRVGYLEQDPQLDPNKTLWQTIFHSENELVTALRNYELALEKPDATDELQACIAEMDRLQAWDAEQRLREILSKLNLEKFDQRVSELSGGQKRRLALAEVLIDAPDFLILDEPTNHLDVDMVEWLEGYLKASNLTLLMVTHDRYFLDRVCSSILELDGGQLYKYDGSYSYFLEKKQERKEGERAQVERARNLYRRELDWMRSTPQARTTKSKSRIDSFYDVKAKAAAKLEQKQVELDLRMDRLGSKIVELHKLKKGFGEKQLIHNLDYVFKGGDRIGIVGRNGAGKSTLVKLITGELEPNGGKVVIGETVKFGYYGQDGLKNKDHLRVIEVIKEIAEYLPTGKGANLTASQLLERFLFEGEQQYTYVAKLSGGEKRRLYLLTVLMANPNFLILDEPTNDLDLLTLNALEEFLLDYPGILVVVSHDRFFLDKLCNHLFVFEGNGQVKDYNGSYSEYRDTLKNKEEFEKRAFQGLKRTAEPEKKTAKPNSKRSYKQEKRFAELEELLDQGNARRQEILAYFEGPEQDADRIQQYSEELDQFQNNLDEWEMEWLELSELDPN